MIKRINLSEYNRLLTNRIKESIKKKNIKFNFNKLEDIMLDIALDNNDIKQIFECGKVYFYWKKITKKNMLAYFDYNTLKVGCDNYETIASKLFNIVKGKIKS